jgi:hypothetical protein
MPLDVVTTRLMTQSSAGQYTGLFDCLLTVAKDEGLPALFRGVVPRSIIILLRKGPLYLLNAVSLATEGIDVPAALFELLDYLEDELV